MINYFNPNQFLSAKQFADLLEIDIKKLDYRIKRGYIPPPDLILGIQRFWSKNVVLGHFESIKKDIDNKVEFLRTDRGGGVE